MSSKVWGGRFTASPNQLVEEMNASISFDQALLDEDIEGSIAHVAMLARCGIVEEAEAEKLTEGLKKVHEKVTSGVATLSAQYEDIHMNVEMLLHEEVGELAGKLHTARSRNDQVATDMHLYLKKKVHNIIGLLKDVQHVLCDKAEAHLDTIVPGYTHLQRAQPISFAHHLLAYFWMFQRDTGRLEDSLKRIDVSPLGAGAIAGTTFPIDRTFTAELLGFDEVYPNSMDAVSDRDFIVEFLSNASMLMMHISRLSEEMIIWSSEEFKFVEFDDTFCTGSSMMPQKKNPDMPELLRGKTGRVYGHLMGLLTTLKGLPLTYNKDMQEDKEGMFDTVETLEKSLSVLAPMIESMTVRSEHMYESVKQDYSNATDLADYLVTKGMAFRKAHEVTGKIVLTAIQEKKNLLEVSLEEYKSYSSSIEADIYNCLRPESVVAARDSLGGTAPNQVKKQLNHAKSLLKSNY
ncbi:argininosuccinate lyase [Pontibacillus salipaludis]|uniref:argininosuccinate lyase n=1 Tax=Pontibacillus salipaludis TaxID=1697394 RepID=UPI0031E7BA4E